MKRVLLLTAVLAICLVTGCAGVKTYDDPGQAIDIGVNQQFVIALDSNPTTGYSWQASYDGTMLELVGGKSEYKAAKPGLIGSGGVEYFHFKALKTGQTQITLVYRRSWETPTPQDLTKVFTVHIR